MYSFDNHSSSRGSISSVLTLPVSRERQGKLVHNFSHESDVTSLQDPFDIPLSVLFLSHVPKSLSKFAQSITELVESRPSVQNKFVYQYKLRSR